MEVLPVPKVQSGVLLALRLFDIAYAIDLARAEAIWAARGSSRSQISMTPAKAVAFEVPPVLLSLDSISLPIDGVVHRLAVQARLYDFGAATLMLRLPVQDVDWSTYCQLANALDAAVGDGSDTEIWQTLLAELRLSLAPALIRPSESTMQEDYLLAVIHAWSEPLSAVELQARVDLVPLLSGEQRPLSEGARNDLLRHRYSYHQDDLVVLTWDRAFICEPRRDSDVADVIEVANAQLLELRYYAGLLDDELPRMYDHVEAERGTGRLSGLLAPRRFARLARRLYTLVAEVTEITEQIDNALQVTEDVYLARVYSAALEQFRVASVSAALNRKLAIIRDTYTALHDEASGARGALMEAAIIALILIELVLAIVERA